MSDELLTRLDHVGRNWMPNRETDVYGLAREAAARIRALEERFAAPSMQRGTTHWEDCWKDRGHHACAVAAVERLQSDLAAARADAENLRDLLQYVGVAVEEYATREDIPPSIPMEDLAMKASVLTAALSPTVSEGAGEVT